MLQRGVGSQGFSLQLARILWGCFLVSACLIMMIAHMMHPLPTSRSAAAFKWAFVAVGAMDIVLIGAVRRNLLERSREKSLRGEAAAAKAGWSTAQLMGFASGESIVLFGFVLSMMVQGWFSTAFYVAGLLLLASYWPQPAE